MNRKTNIFYNTENDTKFITFDNYSEALTGDILATDQKLWPSRFICMYIKELDGDNNIIRNENKIDFINNYLVPYYENKLAFLRDNISNDADLVNIMSLKYLISLIYYYAGKKNGKSYTKIFDVENELKSNTYYTNDLTVEDININYISDIVEQDYNGTYADIICTIQTNVKYKPTLLFEDDNSQFTYKSYWNALPLNTLYGWQNENATTSEKLMDYIKKPVIFDSIVNDENVYYVDSIIKSIRVDEFSDNSLKFNVIIPLFDSSYINKTELEENDELILNNVKNVPLGIYFTGKTVELECENGMFNTSWSLLISMQFKSFPYSFNITHNFDDSDSIKEGYITFAEILARQNITSESILQYSNQIKELRNKISSLESIVKSMSTVQSLDELILEISNLKTKINDQNDIINAKITELQNRIEDSRLKWDIHKSKE